MSITVTDRGKLLPFVQPAAARRPRSHPVAKPEAVSLLHPDFERKPSRLIDLWRARIAWRRSLSREFMDAPDEMLADFGLSHRALADYVDRPFWKA